MKFGNKKPEKIPMYHYHSSEHARSSGSAGTKRAEDRLFYFHTERGEG